MSPLDSSARARALAAGLALAASLLLDAEAIARNGGPAETRPTAFPSPATTPEPAAEAADSPRASVRAFVGLTAHEGDYQGAARYLVLPPEEEPRGPELARRLRAVLERHLDVELDAVSPLSEGTPRDGLPAWVDSVGNVPDGRGGQASVFVVRTRDGAGSYWAFSRQTVSRIDSWYDTLPDRWVRDWMPNELQLYGPKGLMWWQWLALPVLLVLALVLGRILGVLTSAVLRRLFRRTRTEWDERLLRRTSPALTLLWAVAVAAALLPWLALLPEARRFVQSLLGGLATLAAFWALWRSVDVWAQFLMERPWAAANPSARSILSVTRNLAKFCVAVGGLVATLAAFGYPVATVLAGLGIGGIALAFGAQKTIENLFGSISLASDQPFRVGDFVRIEDFVGNVEHIGMRSTRIRTLDRTLVSIPNGKLAEMRIEDFASRDRILLATTIGVVYETTRAQIEHIVSGMEKVLRDHPLIWPDTVVVRFAALGASSLDLEVMAWFRTSDFDVFRDCRQEVLFGFMRVVEEAGSRLAFPTRTVHLVTEAPGAVRPGPASRAEAGPSL
jgi:MscS family membrane protein